MELHYTASEGDRFRALRPVLRESLRLSAAAVRQLKAADAIFVNGQPVHTDYRLAPGDRLTVRLTEPEPAFPAEEGPLSVLWEDEDYLAVDKPQGLIVHPTHSRLTGTLANAAWARIRSGGGEGCHILNRLDRDTAGVVLFAKNARACALMADRFTGKEYLAAVYGAPPAEAGSITLPIRRAAETDMRRVCAADGQPARTDYRLLETREDRSLLRLRLFTGRTHQIRVHCAACGFPLLGDRLYGTELSLACSDGLGLQAHALRCVSLRFRHPLTEEIVVLTAPPTERIFTEAFFADWKL